MSKMRRGRQENEQDRRIRRETRKKEVEEHKDEEAKEQEKEREQGVDHSVLRQCHVRSSSLASVELD